MMELFSIVFIIGLVAGSKTKEYTSKEQEIEDVESRAKLLQQQLLMGGEQVKHAHT